MRDNRPASALHSPRAPSAGITAGGVMLTHDALSAASARARRSTTASSAPTVNTATATTTNSGHQAWTMRQARPAAYDSHAHRLGGSHRNDATGESAAVHLSDVDADQTDRA
ncbi:hypothetical protein ACFOWZ_17205 [Lentzea rhizosphaerae]|uniref:Uncharacterized protein n=1 Tax=Lentzea rhizosphaerae TaxID=2041025 RepID=A0ABV8BT75_9PSEU